MIFNKIFVFSSLILFAMVLVENTVAQNSGYKNQASSKNPVKDWSEFFPEIADCVRATEGVKKYKGQYYQNATYNLKDDLVIEKQLKAENNPEFNPPGNDWQIQIFKIFPEIKSQCGWLRVEIGSPPKPKVKVIPYGGETERTPIKINNYDASILNYGCDYSPCQFAFFETLEIYFGKNKKILISIRKDIAKARELAEKIDYEKLKKAINNSL